MQKRQSRRGGRAIIAMSGVFGLIASLAVTVPALAADNASQRTLGFLLTKFSPAVYYGKFEDDCPHGFEKSTEENFLASVSDTERRRLLKPENARELSRRWKLDFTTGPNGEDVCRQVRSFTDDEAHAIYKGPKSKISYGVNLDDDQTGAAKGFTCKHGNFTSPDGEAGVDNQLYRAIGCHKTWRGLARDPGGDLQQKYDQSTKDGMYQTLVQIRNVDNLLNDDDIEIGIYSSQDFSMVDKSQNHLPDQTFLISKNPKWRNIARGKIVNGVITSEPADVRLSWANGLNGEAGRANEYELRRARFRMQILPDGKLLGVLGAYQPPENIVQWARNAGKGIASIVNRDCASEYRTLLAFADGFPDPKTGRCTMVSMANDVEGVPAFILLPENAVASVQSSSEK